MKFNCNFTQLFYTPSRLLTEKSSMYNPYDFYFKKAKTQGYKARSAFKLEEIQTKFHLVTKDTKTVLDIGCAP